MKCAEGIKCKCSCYEIFLHSVRDLAVKVHLFALISPEIKPCNTLVSAELAAPLDGSSFASRTNTHKMTSYE